MPARGRYLQGYIEEIFYSALCKEAKRLGISNSEYLRSLVIRELRDKELVSQEQLASVAMGTVALTGG